jgi:hypothetical protein
MIKKQNNSGLKKRQLIKSTLRQDTSSASFNVIKSKRNQNSADEVKNINFKIHIRCTGEFFFVNDYSPLSKVKDLKASLEFICGIPYNLHRLSYLDDGNLICLDRRSLSLRN